MAFRSIELTSRNFSRDSGVPIYSIIPHHRTRSRVRRRLACAYVDRSRAARVRPEIVRDTGKYRYLAGQASCFGAPAETIGGECAKQVGRCRWPSLVPTAERWHDGCRQR